MASVTADARDPFVSCCDDPIVSERDDRLVVKLNLFSFDGAFHVDLQTHLLQRVGMHPGVENLVAAIRSSAVARPAEIGAEHEIERRWRICARASRSPKTDSSTVSSNPHRGSASGIAIRRQSALRRK